MKKSACLINSLLFPAVIALILTGCSGGSALSGHKQAIESVTEDEYVVPKKPVDRHCIGFAWSKQFGPIEDSSLPDIRIKKERSLNSVQQEFAYNVGFGLGGQMMSGPQAVAGIEKGRADRSKLEGIEIITPVTLADIPFEPGIPYVGEALRLRNFALKQESGGGVKLGGSANVGVASGTALASISGADKKSTEGEGLVVAYKLYTIDKGEYTKKDHGTVPLQLDKTLDIPGAQVFIKARLQAIEVGGKKSLPRNIIWSCPRADAKSRDAVAAWVIDIKSTDPKRRSLSIAFPAFPKIEDCYNYGSIIHSRIDPVTDRIIRQKINISVIEAEVTDNLTPKTWETRVTLVDESFKIKMIKPSEL